MRRTRPTTGLQADDIKRAVTMPDLLERLGMDPPRQGFILCPFHQDSDASLKVYQGDRGWYCFGCGQGGSVIDFVMQYLGLSFSDAVQELGRMYGLVGGFSFSQVGAYVVGAGITEEVNALPKITVGAIAKMLVGKTIKAHVRLTRKSQLLVEQGETTGLYYEIGKVYKWSDWESVDLDSVDSEPDFSWLPPPDPEDDSVLPF